MMCGVDLFVLQNKEHYLWIGELGSMIKVKNYEKCKSVKLFVHIFTRFCGVLKFTMTLTFLKHPDGRLLIVQNAF